MQLVGLLYMYIVSEWAAGAMVWRRRDPTALAVPVACAASRVVYFLMAQAHVRSQAMGLVMLQFHGTCAHACRGRMLQWTSGITTCRVQRCFACYRGRRSFKQRSGRKPCHRIHRELTLY